MGELKPDILIATDVNHDYEAAPGIGARNMNPLKMGEGFTIGRGAVASEPLVQMLVNVCREKGIPHQLDFSGRDMGTDGMAAALAGVDSAAMTVATQSATCTPHQSQRILAICKPLSTRLLNCFAISMT
ncbi:endoglucanase [Vibrio sp. JCM 19236]|nr:endoglucanase [Vibrio sp. JCM 19236]